MGGYLRIEDISRTIATGLSSLRISPDDLPPNSARDSREMAVATEILRATPRFWSGAALWVHWLDGRGADLELRSLDAIPVHASPTRRLHVAAARLHDSMAMDDRIEWRSALVLVAWTSPKTWAWDCAYWRRRVTDSPHWDSVQTITRIIDTV